VGLAHEQQVEQQQEHDQADHGVRRDQRVGTVLREQRGTQDRDRHAEVDDDTGPVAGAGALVGSQVEQGGAAGHHRGSDCGAVEGAGDEQRRDAVGRHEDHEPDDHRDRGADQKRLAAVAVGDLAGDQHRAQRGERVRREHQRRGDRGEVPLALVDAVQRRRRTGDAEGDGEQGDQESVGSEHRFLQQIMLSSMYVERRR
jgi:hypothetical protein